MSSREYEALRNYREVARKVKEIVIEEDPRAEVYVFGSVVRGTYTAASDIDLLVVTTNINKKHEIMVKVYKTIDAPIELHIITPELYEKWYKRFISSNELVKV
ncbi:MAG: nucleotidyltransferase domain-containing protein [Desulfurococcales archaeon]|nr:nucleotidyltransferase domain-containing protein [Desulfurococcales archaeon]